MISEDVLLGFGGYEIGATIDFEGDECVRVRDIVLQTSVTHDLKIEAKDLTEATLNRLVSRARKQLRDYIDEQ